MFGGVFDIENYNSIVSIQNCTFESNYAFIYSVKAGGGCVLMIKGDTTTIVLSSNNFFYNSGTTLRGEQVSFDYLKKFSRCYHCFCWCL